MSLARNLGTFSANVNSSGTITTVPTTSLTGTIGATQMANTHSYTVGGLTVGSSGITFNDNTTQTGASTYVGSRGQVFTSSGTFTIPSGVTAVKVTVVGAGSGGAGGNANYYGPGGAGGGTAIKYLSGLTPGNTLSVTVGTGGSGGGSEMGTGAAGGNSTVSSNTQIITTITGGGGGATAWYNTNIAGSGTPGTGTNGDINLYGGYGYQNGQVWPYVESGSAAIFASRSYARVGLYGEGGQGGARGGCGYGGAGGAGSSGIVIFEW